MGLMQTDTVQVTAEAYDVAMDISFPRGTCTFIQVTYTYNIIYICASIYYNDHRCCL